VTTGRAGAAVCLFFTWPLVADGGRAAEVAAWLAGTFELKDQGSDGAPEAVRIIIVAVPKSRIANGALVLYREEAAAPTLDVPSQQRFYRLEAEGDVVRMRAFDPKDPVLVRGKWRDPSALALYGASDMRERPGCTMLFRKSGDLWEGETPGTDCPSTVRTAATMTSVLILAKDGFTQRDRGFDEEGRQTWKSPEGGMRFLKTSPNPPVDDKLIERPVGRRAERAAGTTEPARAAGAAGTISAEPAAGEARAKDGFSANGQEGAGTGAAPKGPSLELVGPRLPSRKISVTDLRDALSTRTSLSRILPLLGVETEGADARGALASAVFLVTGRDGSSAAFSVDEVLAADGPELDLKDVPSLIFPRSPGRAVHDVVSIELKVLAANPKQP
jgi:CpeT protein